jgi:5-methyltetrahydrofolate corrinoid/iron sulfur protein methyltransferase
MYVIGERINGMFKDVRNAVPKRDKKVIQDLAKRQLASGAKALDLNVGPVKGDQAQNLMWLVETVQEVTDAPLCIDTPKWAVMEAVVPKVKNPVIINSSKADEEELTRYVRLAADNDASLVALTIDKTGVPSDADARVAMSATILTKAAEGGLTADRLFIDPIILPTNVASKQPKAVLKAIQQLVMLSDPPPHIVLGLSNVSQNCSRRELINRTYMAMAMACGLDAAIMDPMDKELMETAITAELLLEKMIYCDSFIEAYLSSKK